ncbi:hypothetical protein C5B85_11980 [Pseudoclavibacter sp. AY1F1]|uniref:hypothetical protein n=1 Tax=Pseudoclavibacter sp. AY1F1 TaxID=2080583 RepID=UPI000CE8CC20|nr:hypothetical protein [Pseudoclavibacter sp. AY1F1]PPF43860.1 hypothetical protein C5B85_11980 [Pseudoclavibacter sp. AY1F1]
MRTHHELEDSVGEPLLHERLNLLTRVVVIASVFSAIVALWMLIPLILSSWFADLVGWALVFGGMVGLQLLLA